MFDRNIEIFQYAGHFTDKSTFTAEQCLVHGDYGKVLASGDPRHGFFIAAIVMSIIGVIGFYICYRNTRENVPVLRNTEAEKKAGFADYIKVVFTNKPLLCIILMTLFTISAMNTNNQMMIFFWKMMKMKIQIMNYRKTMMM